MPNEKKDCVKSVQIRSFFWSVFFRIRTEYGDLPWISIFTPNAGKYGPEKCPYLNTFHTVTTQKLTWKYFLSLWADTMALIHLFPDCHKCSDNAPPTFHTECKVTYSSLCYQQTNRCTKCRLKILSKPWTTTCFKLILLNLFFLLMKFIKVWYIVKEQSSSTLISIQKQF